MKALERAVEKADGVTKLAEHLGVSPQVIVNWRKRGIPAERALEVEEKTLGKPWQITAIEVLEHAKQQRATA